jgi:hypothetical protein
VALKLVSGGIVQPNPALLAFFEQYARQVLTRIQANRPFTRKVSEILLRQPRNELPSIEAIADELVMGVRNLQKKLRLENTSF